MRKSNNKPASCAGLDEQNKSEFFDFLLKNNITFVEGEENYIAKVTIKKETAEKKTPLAQRKSISNIPQKSTQSKIARKEVKTPTKKDRTPLLMKNKSTPVKENTNNTNRSKTKS